MVMNAIKISTNVFCYEIIGTQKNIIYNDHSRRLLVTRRCDGVILHDEDVDKNLDFESFVLVARDFYLSMINDLQAN